MVARVVFRMLPLVLLGLVALSVPAFAQGAADIPGGCIVTTTGMTGGAGSAAMTVWSPAGSSFLGSFSFFNSYSFVAAAHRWFIQYAVLSPARPLATVARASRFAGAGTSTIRGARVAWR